MEDFGPSLATLINLFLKDGPSLEVTDGGGETVVGWVLQVDREININRVATNYFMSFYQSLLKVILSNVVPYIAPAGAISSSSDYYRRLLAELNALCNEMRGLLVIRDANGDTLRTEFVSLSLPMSFADWSYSLLDNSFLLDALPKLKLSSMNSQMMTGLDERIGLGWFDTDLLGRIAISKLSKEVSAKTSNNLSTTVKATEKGDSGGRRKGKRAMHLNRGVNPATGLNSCRSIDHELILELGSVVIKKDVDLVESVIFAKGPPSISLGQLPPRLQKDIEEGIRKKEVFLEEFYGSEAIQPAIDVMEEECGEYELLLLVYKVLAQSDEMIMKKVNGIEEYEERMKKLGDRIKEALSPEDLLKSLTAATTNL